jgi:phage terminase large subunit-like protein
VIAPYGDIAIELAARSTPTHLYRRHWSRPILLAISRAAKIGFKRYREGERPERFDRIVQSWDTANKATELSDFSVCTTRGVRIHFPPAESRANFI